MGLVVPNAGELQLLDKMLKDALSTDENYILKLYKVSYQPVKTSVTSNFTEATFTNYAARTLTRTAWGPAATVSDKASSTYSVVQSWTCGATGNTVHGYYMVPAAVAATALWAEKFTTARVLASGDVLNITPKFTLASETSN
jgi:hypothetical protein